MTAAAATGPLRAAWAALACRILALAALFGAPDALHAQTATLWPTKPIKAYIPFAAGSATDIVPRALFEPLAAELGQPIVVENRGGAGGTIAVGTVVRAAPDGYTILANSSAHAIAPLMVPNIPYDTVRDLRSALMIGQNANVLIVSPAKGWGTVQSLVGAAKAEPGAITYGSAGVGTATHISAERFRISAGFEAVHVPYKGGAEALADVLGGRIDFYFCPITTALPFIREGRVIALVVSTPKRASALPDVPTSTEAGYPDSNTTTWYAVFMPARTPSEVVDKFHAAANKVLAAPAMQQRLRQLALESMPMHPAEIDRFVADEIAANERLFKAAGIR